MHEEFWEQPRSVTGFKTVGDLAPLGTRWSYPITDESRRTFAGVYPQALSKQLCDRYFHMVNENTPWVQPVGPIGPIPRKTAWMVTPGCRCTYCYGKIAVEATPYTPWMVEIMQVVMPLCGMPHMWQWPNACNVNIYQDASHTVGWHTDDEPLFQGKFRDCLIISLSLGETRAFEISLNWPEGDETKKWRVPVRSGDLMTMEGMFQKHYLHRVPKENRPCGPRINLTWRWIVQHNRDCKAAGVGTVNQQEALQPLLHQALQQALGAPPCHHEQ